MKEEKKHNKTEKKKKKLFITIDWLIKINRILGWCKTDFYFSNILRDQEKKKEYLETMLRFSIFLSLQAIIFFNCFLVN